MRMVGIMDERHASTVDVRAMLCAQALAVVAKSLERVPVGTTVRVLYDAADVKADLLVWAAQRGYPVGAEDPSALWIERRA